MTVLFLSLAYLVGCIPTSFVVGKAVRGIDLRKHGSGNLGATNAFRVLGWRAAVPILLFDTFKGWAPAALFPHWDTNTGLDWALVYGAAAVIGHAFSIFVTFRGGKGVATGAGVFLALAPVAVLAALAVWGALVLLTGFVSLGSIIASALLPALIALTVGTGATFWLSIGVAAFVVYGHRKNVGRLLRGEEHRFGRRARGVG